MNQRDGPKEDVAGDLGGVARPIQHQPVAHPVEQIASQLRPGGPLDHDALLQPGEHVVVDAVAPARLARRPRVHRPGCPPSPPMSTLARMALSAAVVTHDARRPRADDGVPPDGSPARVIQPEPDAGAVGPVLQEGVAPAERGGEAGAKRGRRHRCGTPGCRLTAGPSAAAPARRNPRLDAVRSLSTMVFESLASRSSTAAAPQSAGGHLRLAAPGMVRRSGR